MDNVSVPLPFPPGIPFWYNQAAWDDADTLLQLPGVGPAQAARLRSRGVKTLRDLALLGEPSARKSLDSCGLSSIADSRTARAGGSIGSEGRDDGGRGSVGAALRALAAIPVVKDLSLRVRPAGGSGIAEGVSGLVRLKTVARGLEVRENGSAFFFLRRESLLGETGAAWRAFSDGVVECSCVCRCPLYLPMRLTLYDLHQLLSNRSCWVWHVLLAKRFR